MKEQIIKFETAKLAKKKGLDLQVQWTYTSENSSAFADFFDDYENWNEFEDNYSAPTQSLLQKWLRDVHNIHVNSEPYYESADFSGELTGYYVGSIYNKNKMCADMSDSNYPTYEEALEAGLFEALKLIK